MMTPKQLELFAIAVLKVLDANNTRFGLTAAAIRLLVRQFAFSPTDEETIDGLEYLASKGLVAESPKVLVRINRAWKITDEGRQFLDDGNL
jgi:hypothetical protein